MKRNSKQGLLWKFYRPGKENTPSFLFGSMHQFPAAEWPRREQLFRLIEGQTLQWLAVETALDEANALDLSKPELQLTKPLSKAIPPKRFERLRKLLLKNTGIDVLLFEHLPPFILQQQIQQHWLNQMGPLHAIDAELWEQAQKAGLNCYGLESHEEHYGLLSKIPPDEQVKLILHNTRNIRRSRKKLLHLYRLYRDEQLPLLHRLSKRGMGKLRHSMLYQRNFLMTPRIARYADQAPGLAVVGAAHLTGGKGIIRLLKKQGFQIKKA